MGKLQVVVGGQFGSEAKGAVTAHLLRSNGNGALAVRVAGPNAGHTAYDQYGRAWVMRQLPMSVAVRPRSPMAIAAGSEIDLAVLHDEVARFEQVWGWSPDLRIDPQATILRPDHQQQEAEGKLTERVGSTGKGIGAARSDRIMRRAEIAGHNRELQVGAQSGRWRIEPVDQLCRQWLAAGHDVVVEGTQGYGLGLHAGYYPTCTSSDCRAIDFLAMVGVSPWDRAVTGLEVWVVLRTYPIRVAGASGPMHDELSWDELNDEIEQRGGARIEPERTTVTQKVRRVGRWDGPLAKAAVAANGGPGTVRAALMFADYIDPTCYGVTSWDKLRDQASSWIYQRELELGVQIELVGTGPQTIIDRRAKAGMVLGGQQEAML